MPEQSEKTGRLFAYLCQTRKIPPHIVEELLHTGLLYQSENTVQCERDGQQKTFHNHYTVVSRTGAVQADYVKIHPFSLSGEDSYYIAGSQTAVFPFAGHTFGLFICYDLRFPEIFRAAAAAVDVMIVAANWPEKRIAHWNKLLEARALENQCWVLGINCVGNQENLHYNGSSRAVNPEGETVDCLCDREGIIFCEIQDEAAAFRNSFPALRDRRPALYKELMKKSVSIGK